MNQPADLILTPAARAQLSREAAVAYPLEACGALLGSGDQAIAVHPLTNRALHRRDSFAIDPAELEPLLREEANGGLPVIGFYHSHPDSESVPSTQDLDGAWPGYWYVITGVTGHTYTWRVDHLEGRGG